MEETKKINLSAMIKQPWKQQEKEVLKPIVVEEKLQDISNDIPKEKSVDTPPSIKKTGIKINIASIKSEHIAEEEVEELKEEVIKDEKTLFYESLTSNVLWKDKDTNLENIQKIDLKSLKKSDIENNQIDKNESSTITDKEWNEKEVCNIQEHNMNNNHDLFSNYESDYKKKESRVIETIHKLKKLADIKKLTKTNKIFVVSIIMATIVWISFLFYIDPETHSLENYKASILTIAWREVTQQELLMHQTDIENDIKWQLNENRLWWYKLDFEMLANENGEAIYKFDGLEYTTKELLDIAITEKLKFLKKEKIKDYLKNQTEISQ